MKIQLKTAVALLFAASLTGRLHAQCGIAGRPFGNTTLGAFGPYTGLIPDTDIELKTYDIAAPATNHNGSCSTAAQFPTLAGNRGINSSWTSACMAGCLASGSGRMIGLVSNRTGEGTAAHAGQFVVASVGWRAANSKWDLDMVTNGNGGTSGCPGAIPCQMRPNFMPVLYHSTDPASGATYVHALGTGLIRVTFAMPAVRGFFDVDPGVDLITGYEIRQINVPDTTCNITPGPAPTTNARSAWGAVLTTSPAGGITNADCSAGSCTKLVSVTALPACNRAYFSISFMVGGSWATPFVSANSNSVLTGPTATSGLPGRVDVYSMATGGIPGVQIRWSTTNETQIAGFNLLASRTASGGYRQINVSQIPAAGSPNTYLQRVTRRTFVTLLGMTDTVHLKLVTVLKDGTTREVGPASFTLSLLEPGGRGGKGGEREGRATAP